MRAQERIAHTKLRKTEISTVCQGKASAVGIKGKNWMYETEAFSPIGSCKVKQGFRQRAFSLYRARQAHLHAVWKALEAESRADGDGSLHAVVANEQGFS